MNSFQIKTIVKAVESMEKAESGDFYRHKLDEWERNFIDSLRDRDPDYQLSTKENHKLNKIREKL